MIGTFLVSQMGKGRNYLEALWELEDAHKLTREGV